MDTDDISHLLIILMIVNYKLCPCFKMRLGSVLLQGSDHFIDERKDGNNYGLTAIRVGYFVGVFQL